MLDVSEPDFSPRVVLALEFVLDCGGAVNSVGWIGHWDDSYWFVNDFQIELAILRGFSGREPEENNKVYDQ